MFSGKRINQRNRMTPMIGWGVSLAVHLLLAVVLVLFAIGSGEQKRPSREVPKSMLENMDDDKLVLEPVVEDLELSPLDLEDVDDLSNQDFEDTDLAVSEIGNDDVSDGSIVVTVRSDIGGLYVRGDDGAANGVTRFCGSSGKANRLCFLVDCSGSMVMAFDYVCSQLCRSIGRLNPGQYFGIVFFARGDPIELSPGILLRGNEANKERAIAFIKAQKLVSVADEQAAWKGVVAGLERAFGAVDSGNDNIELLYLLTDGEFDHQRVGDFIRDSQGKLDRYAIINVIACGSRESERFLRLLASSYGGSYKFLNDEQLVKSNSGR